ncbi:phenylalanine--tRNA ligase subunit beta [Candidatus Dependentiae bacterium]|nr:phenylalanine--tRNA ligase subunit beta [Candidatus Dependentiae bacterium]
MKLSLNWIFDHINAALSHQNVEQIIKRFNEVSAEIDGVCHMTYDNDSLYTAVVKNKTSEHVEAFIAETNQTINLSIRSDAQNNQSNSVVFLVKKVAGSFDWATYKDMGQESETLIPALWLDQKYHDGSWRNLIPTHDTIIEVDNKTITHRPDMWGHRGFAREITAFMNLPLKPHNQVTDSLENTEHNSSMKIAGAIESEQCSRLVLAYLSSIENRASDFFIGIRLMRLGSKIFGAIVDLTNYVMLDWSQPSHAYDAAEIAENKIIVRHAKTDEEITILDGSVKKLSPQDVVIASPEKALCIAGIKGGLNSGITKKTTSAVLEFATFDATSVRKTAHKLNLRTDASARFEKTLSSEQPIEALARFMFLAKQLSLNPVISGPIVNIANNPNKPITITIEHHFIESRMGIILSKEQILDMLSSLEFEISCATQNQITTYTIKVPHFRASKDIRIREDIIEEITRMYGFDKIPLSLPSRTTAPSDMAINAHERNLKRILSNVGGMFEQKNYMYFDSSFTEQLGLDTSKCLSIVNPVSSNQSLLVDSLIPGLLKNVEDNILEYDALSFFEINATWNLQPAQTYKEEQRLSGIFFSRRSKAHFLQKKTILSRLLDEADLKTADWKASSEPLYACFDPEQTASIYHENKLIGFVGFIRKEIINKLTGTLPESSAIIFDFDYSVLKNNKKTLVKFKPISRYQASSVDVSFLVPATVSYEFIATKLKALDSSISELSLIDSFTKKEWNGDRSLTFRLKISSHDKTTDKNDIDSILSKITSFAQQHKLSLRE